MVLGCLTCGGCVSDNAVRFSLSDRRKGLQGIWQLIECDKCGVVSVTPAPTDDQLATYYASYKKYGKSELGQSFGSRYPKVRKVFHFLTGDVDPGDFVLVPAGARVLDYGCGDAGYLCDFHHQGVEISGAEIEEHVVEECRSNGYNVHKVSDFSRIPFIDGEFDIVYLIQVFEHLREPHVFMEELARILKGGGMLYLAVPNKDSIWSKVFGTNWVSGWFVPFHLFLYNCDSLTKLAQEHGFVVEEAWSKTPESWFRLNLKALVYPKEKRLDYRRTWLDSFPIRVLVMLILRVIELLFMEHDCLVLKLRKRY